MMSSKRPRLGASPPDRSAPASACEVCRSGGRVAQAMVSFVVMAVVLRFSMKETKSASRRADAGTCIQALEHWKHLRTTNVIESSFATVHHRTVRSKGCLSNKTALAMIFKLAEAAEKNWRCLDGHNQLPKVILGVNFTDGMEIVKPQAQAAAA